MDSAESVDEESRAKEGVMRDEAKRVYVKKTRSGWKGREVVFSYSVDD